MLDRARRRANPRARQVLARVADRTRDELDRVVFAVVTERFGDRFRTRRRHSAAQAIVAGIPPGAARRHGLHR